MPGCGGGLSWPDLSRLTWLETVSGIGMLIGYLGAVVALGVRFRRGSEQVRRQLLWLLPAMLIVLTLFTLDPLLPDSVLTIFPIALLPLSITVAMLRHQLLDIRLVFSRSVLYLLLTAGVVGSYLAMVALLDRVLRDQVALGPSVLATAVVTLAVDPDALHVGVHDDGVDVGGDWQPGVGLTSIRERAAELGGRCTIQHDRSGGRVDVHLPLAAASGRPAARSCYRGRRARYTRAGGRLRHTVLLSTTSSNVV
ncbi:hypothetical protein DKM19_19400 [Streptosporangium sp. 'caverna']|nr:hypothetical protein DKM19_19400 [Streptosporangium sp. 'caverna']